ncbi:MAG: DUF4296 domain-containing protein [Bacteroidales bacterium]|nr:DUF4296 domain-containing protein [Bacteroidales bacterium]
MTSNKTLPYFAILLVLLTINAGIAGCKREKEISGKEYIPRDVLVDVLLDMHLMDAITNDMLYYRKFNPEDSIDLYSAIYEKHGVDQAMYERTIEAYSKHPELLNTIYDEVLMKLQLQQDQVDKESANKQNAKLKPGNPKGTIK